jgi:hypothetical protein
VSHDPRLTLRKVAWAITAAPFAAYALYGFARLGWAMLRHVWRDMRGDEKFRARQRRRPLRRRQQPGGGAGQGR